MKERPIIFSTESVKAILEGRKTMTRRVVKWKEAYRICSHCGEHIDVMDDEYSHQLGEIFLYKHRYQAGDRLWVREKWFSDEKDLEYARAIHEDMMQSPGPIFYKASEENPDIFPKWRPSIHMPKWAARIWLEVTGVRVERLQEIEYNDVTKQGFFHTVSFIETWNKLNAKLGYSWESNPYVWVIEFKRTEP